MLKTIDSDEIPAFLDEISTALRNNAVVTERTISTPAKIRVDNVYVFDSYRTWIYAPGKINIRGDCYNFFIGLVESETPAVELNIATVPTNLKIAGRCLKNENGDYFLGHAGYLSGGRRNVPKAVFQSHMSMRGFRLENFRRGDDHAVLEAYVFRISCKEFISSLSTYAKACADIRKEMRH